MGFEFDALSLFGLAAVCASLFCYIMERRSPWWILGFAFAKESVPIRYAGTMAELKTNDAVRAQYLSV